MLNEVSKDISFALDVFDKERHRKQMEESILQSELRLNQAQAVAHIGSWVFNFSTGVSIWSEEACRIYGLDPRDNKIPPCRSVSFTHPDDIDIVNKITNNSLKKFTSFSFQHRIIRTDGVERTVFSEGHYEFDSNKHPIGIFGIIHDITEAKKAEEALALSEENLRMIMNRIPQCIFAKNESGQFVFVNESYSKLYGLSANQMIKRDIRDLLPVKVESQKFLLEDQEVIRLGETLEIPEHTINDINGVKRVFNTIKIPFVVAGTNEKAVLGISFEITEQIRVEKEREKMVADIIQRNLDLEQFSYIVSHNLRAPVANILGLSALMDLPGENIISIAELMDSLTVSVKRLDGVISDLNYILQVREDINEHKEIVHFSELVKDIKISIENVIRSADVSIITDFAEIDELVSIKSYLYSIFYNLISNSVKYRRQGVKSVIQIASNIQNGNITLVFRDNGLGIDLAKKGSQVFGLYKRFHTFVEGKGMGLFMVKTQVQTLGGNITIESEVDKGTTFKIVFKISE